MDLINTIRRALAPFADPATTADVVSTGAQSCTFRFQRKGAELRGAAKSDSNQVTIREGDGPWVPLRTFLSGEQMANLDELARIQSRVLSRSLGKEWVAGPATIDGEDELDSVAAFEKACASVTGQTKVVILDGPAGMGKTTLSTHIARSRAEAFVNRETDSLLLIVSSRGRKLSRLNDAIAATLQDLRAGIFYPEVPVLVRHGLLTLVIDGFDELANQEGYDDAWYSLTELLDSIAGGGTLVLASRDTFFSEQEFVARAQRTDVVWSGRLSFSFLRLGPWSSQEASDLLKQLGTEEESRTKILRFYDSGARTSLLRPFFVRHLSETVARGIDVDPDHLLPELVAGFLQRETALLFGEEADDRVDLLRKFFQELVIEMRTQERDSLDLDVVQFFLDALLEDEGVPEERRRQLVHRAGAVAFLETPESKQRQRRAFPHQIISDYFFAERLLSTLANAESDLSDLLGLDVFGLDLAEVVTELVDGRVGPTVTRSHVQVLLDLAGNAGPTSPVALNAAAFAFALLRSTNVRGSGELKGAQLHLPNVSLAGTVVPALVLEGCSFGFLDLTDAVAVEMRLKDCHLVRMRVSDSTRLPARWACRPGSLEWYAPSGGLISEHDPGAVEKRLRDLREEQDDAGEDMTPGEALLEELNRRWIRRFYLHEDDLDDEPAFGHPLWPALRDILDRYDRLERTVRATSGPKRELLHLKDPRSLLERRHADPKEQRKIEAIWSAAAQLQE